MIKVIIINDLQRENRLLKDYLLKAEGFRILGPFTDIMEVLQLVKKNEVDIVISPGSTLPILFESKKDKPFPILVCMGTHEDISGQPENAGIFAYLRRPISFERVLSLVQNIESYMLHTLTHLSSQRKYVFIKSDYKLIRINLSDILFLSGLRDYTQVYLRGRTSPLITLQNLKEFESRLTEPDFIRVHRSYIISLSQVDSISRNEIRIGDHTIPIGNVYRGQLDTAVGKNS